MNKSSYYGGHSYGEEQSNNNHFHRLPSSSSPTSLLYVIKKVLKKSEHSCITLSESVMDGQLVVLKRVFYNNGNDALLTTRPLNQEAKLLSELPSHPNVIKLHHWFWDPPFDNGQFKKIFKDLIMVLEYCQLGDLDEWRQRKFGSGPIPINEALRLYQEICNGLQHIHQNGVIHRDIKPKNLLIYGSDVEDFNVVKIGDFGIARRLLPQFNGGQDGEEEVVVENGGFGLAETAIGTPYYLAPEVVNGQRYDFAADWWALGCVLYELVNPMGTKPFMGRNIRELLENIRHQPIPQTGLPMIDYLLSNLLQKDPRLRRPSNYSQIPESNGFMANVIKDDTEYVSLCRLVGKERIDRFLGKVNDNNNNHNYENITNNSRLKEDAIKGQRQLQINILRDQLLKVIPCEDLDGVLEILSSYSSSGPISTNDQESRLIECVGKRRHILYQPYYGMCQELTHLLLLMNK